MQKVFADMHAAPSAGLVRMQAPKIIQQAYFAIRQMGVACDITELLIAKLANAALKLQASEGACHGPKAYVPSTCYTTDVATYQQTRMSQSIVYQARWQMHDECDNCDNHMHH